MDTIFLSFKKDNRWDMNLEYMIEKYKHEILLSRVFEELDYLGKKTIYHLFRNTEIKRKNFFTFNIFTKDIDEYLYFGIFFRGENYHNMDDDIYFYYPIKINNLPIINFRFKIIIPQI